MVSHILAKLCKIILENKISLWLESHGKRVKGKASYRRYHSIMDHLVTLRIIAKECHNNKTNTFYCFIDFRKAFDTIPWKKLWNMLEKIIFPLELTIVKTKLYENFIVKFRTIEGC